jgi:hypothetical protein
MPALATAPLVAASLLVLALAGVTSADKGPGFVVTGRVYCDPCRAGFETNVSHSVEGTNRSDNVLASRGEPLRA